MAGPARVVARDAGHRDRDDVAGVVVGPGDVGGPAGRAVRAGRPAGEEGREGEGGGTEHGGGVGFVADCCC